MSESPSIATCRKVPLVLFEFYVGKSLYRYVLCLVLQVKKHKTMSTHNAVVLCMDAELEKKIRFYVEHVRGGIAAIIDSDKLFITFYGKMVTSSNLTATLKHFNSTCTTKIRKFISTVVIVFSFCVGKSLYR